MATWSSRGLRGSIFEELINHTNEIYKKHGLGLIQKIPTPITPIEMDKSHEHITLAYFEKKSTVDYIGIVQKVPICFDAKECNEDRFALANIHEHQMEFMNEFEKQGGISFFLIHFSKYKQFYYLRYEVAKSFFERRDSGGRKSFRIEELDEEYFFTEDPNVPVPYLVPLDMDLEYRKRLEK